MPALKEICDYLDDLLEISRFPHDPSNNGLQFQGVNEVHKAVFAVDASEAVFNIAADTHLLTAAQVTFMATESCSWVISFAARRRLMLAPMVIFMCVCLLCG